MSRPLYIEVGAPWVGRGPSDVGRMVAIVGKAPVRVRRMSGAWGRLAGYRVAIG